MKRSYQVLLLILFVLALDQALKIYIKTTFCYNQDVPILGLSWARLHFVENEGMAFGITFGWEYGKLLLSVFRILMVAALIWYLRMLLAARAPLGLLYSVGLITAGAIGNILDSAFYGLIFTESPYHDCVPARLVPPGQGYGTFLHGKVVDMFYFPIVWIRIPEWLPRIGGEEWLFFSPIFNVADACITVGVLTILLFQRRFFREEMSASSTPAGAEAVPSEEVAPSAQDEAAHQIPAEEERQEKSLSDD
ncbi:MAG: lipoprotein signal peptidase [Saprospiraceae bacterium]|nr:lipoprotein signal peptidase [Saprospiraceae bacterium]MDW8228340.1 lipoprotein signal peptidase [Saprospiraceae bacterium]